MGELDSIDSIGDLDERILRLADHMSPEEISRDIGGVLSPARVHNRIKDILKRRNWLDAIEQEELILWKMRRILGELEQRYLDNDNAKIQLTYLKSIKEMLAERRAATADEKNMLYANQAQIVFEAIRAMIEVAKIDPDARQALIGALPEAVYVLSSRNAGAEIEA